MDATRLIEGPASPRDKSIYDQMPVMRRLVQAHLEELGYERNPDSCGNSFRHHDTTAEPDSYDPISAVYCHTLKNAGHPQLILDRHA